MTKKLFIFCLLLGVFSQLNAQIDLPNKKDGLKFESRLRPDGIRLSWECPREQNNKRYVVERSVRQANNFTRIGEVPMRESQMPRVEYAFLDRTAPTDIALFYRLKIIDTLGQESLSSWLRTSRKVKSFATQVSSANNGNARLSLHCDYEQHISVFLMNVLGQRLWQQYLDFPTGTTAVDIPTDKQPKGLYLIGAVGADGVVQGVRWVKE